MSYLIKVTGAALILIAVFACIFEKEGAGIILFCGFVLLLMPIEREE